MSNPSDEQPVPPSRPPHPATLAAHAARRAALDFSDQADFESARRGLVAAVPDDGVIRNERGRVVWDLDAYRFLQGEDDIDTVDPSLLRMARLNMTNGLFEVCDRVYQLRGLDLANMTIVEGDTGLILIDCI